METKSIPEFLRTSSQHAVAPSPDLLEQQRVRDWILYDVRRQVIVPERVLRLRGYYYYQSGVNPALAGITNLWPALHDGVEEMIRAGDVVPRIISNSRWLQSDSADSALIASKIRRKAPVYNAWKRASNGAGLNGNRLVHAAFMDAGFAVAEKPIKIRTRDKQVIEIDVYTLAPFRIGVEVKNALSEVYCDPRLMEGRHHKEYYQIAEHFEACAKLGITPALVASRIDPSFFAFAKEYGGLAKSMLFQFLPAGHEALCEQISRELRFGNVKVAHRGTFGVVGREAVRVQRTLSNWIRSLTFQVADLTVLNKSSGA